MSLNQDSLDNLKIDREHRRGKGLGIVIWLLVLVVIGAAAGAYWYLRKPPIEVELATAVAAAPSSRPANSAILDASGYVVARREATVSSKVTGKIAEVMIEEGMEVDEGQILARLDDQTLQPQLLLAQSQLEATRKELEEVRVRQGEAVRNLARVETLHAGDAASDGDLDTAQSEVAALNARLDALTSSIQVAEATVAVRRQDLEDLLVRAPFAGVIVSKDAQPGEMVSPISAGGGFTRTGIATIVDMDSREIEVDVNEAYINRVSPGQRTEAVLDAYPDWKIPSHVINIVPTADRQKATVRVRIAFDELDPRILPNMGIKVSFLDSGETPDAASAATSRPAVRIPTAAVMRDGAKSFVWRVRNGEAERVAVVTGPERNGQIDVLAGLSAGDSIVAKPVAGIEAGSAIEVLER